MDGQHSCANFKMFRAGATSHGVDGSQIWVRHDISRYVTAVKVISPRLLRVVIQDGVVKLHVISGHGPIEAASSDEKNSFWIDLAADSESIGEAKTDIIVCGIDGNARLGCILTEFIGANEIDDESANGAALRLFPSETRLCVVNYFSTLAPLGAVRKALWHASTMCLRSLTLLPLSRAV